MLALLFVVQCSNGDTEPPSTAVESTSTPAPTPTATPGPTATPFATPTTIPSPTIAPTPENLERGGILRFAIPEEAPHSDPHLTVSSALASWGAGLAYSRLFKFDADRRTSTVVCDLCESWEQSTPLTFKIKLREDVVWQNFAPLHGRPLSAQDVAYSLNRQSTPGYPNAALLSNIAEITATGDHSIMIRLEVPDSEVLEKLADTHSRIVARNAVEQNGDLRRGPTVGTGPWIANEVQSNAIRLLANTDYYDQDRPYLDGIEIQVIPSSSVRTVGLRTQIIDVAQATYENADLALNDIEELQYIGVENPAAGIEVSLNTDRSPMDKQAVREAMMLTWNPGKSLSRPGGTATTVVGNEFPGVSMGIPLLNLEALLANHVYADRFNDPDKANSILATAQLKPTDNIVITVGEFGEQYIEEANQMAEGLASVGIRADVERVSTRVFGDEVWTAGNYDIMVGAPPPVASTTSYLFAVHHSDGPWNTTGYPDPEIDRLIEAQAREYDETKRGEMLVEIQKLILAGSHRFIAETRATHWMFWDNIHDFEPFTPRGDTDFLTRVWMTAR